MTVRPLIFGGLLLLLLFVNACSDRHDSPDLTYEKVGFADLPGFQKDDMAKALPALVKSCGAIAAMKATSPMHESGSTPNSGLFGVAGDWQQACAALPLDGDTADVRDWLSAHFEPWAVTLKGSSDGTFTGYYEPLLEGSFEKTESYKYPLYPRPDNLVEVDLGNFVEGMKGETIRGKIAGGKLVPYEDRGAIMAGALEGKVEPLLYVNDMVDSFFLHIQGSGRVRLPDGSMQGVGYANKNGQPYVSIGKVIKKSGILPPEEATMQGIRAWAGDNPEGAKELFAHNKSYIFFRLIDAKDGPYGSGTVTLTAERSLAVDRKHLPMHMPLWLATTNPHPDGKQLDDQPFEQLMLAQDTGGAILGEIRGDVFWGFGERAAEIAGRMANKGRYWIFLPKGLDPNANSPKAHS